MKPIYFDSAATTPVMNSVIEKMTPYFSKLFGNPSAAYSLASFSRKAIDEARESVANLIGANTEEIYFTSGGSESDNWAVKGAAFSCLGGKRNKIVTTPIEHHAVLNACDFLKSLGFDIEFIPVDDKGVVKLNEAEKIIDENTRLVSVMAANNEVGTIEPLADIADMAERKGAIFHTDAVQAAGHIKIDVNKLKVHMLSLSGHKFGAPKGIGALYIKNGIDIQPLIHGGGQEKGMRGGTENVPYIAALGEAARYAALNMEAENAHIEIMRKRLMYGLLKEVPNSIINGSTTNRLPSNLNISFLGINGRTLVSVLNKYGIYTSGASACSSSAKEPSHVLRSMMLCDERIRGALRLTIGRDNTDDEIDYAIKIIPEAVEMLRKAGNNG